MISPTRGYKNHKNLRTHLMEAIPLFVRAVDGGLTEWQNWSECNVACAVEGRGGTRVRERYCAAPFPVHGGKKCEGETTEKGECVDLVRKYNRVSIWSDDMLG